MKQIMDLARIYHEAQFLFPYWTDDLLKEWTAAYEQLLATVSQGLTEREFYLELMKLATLLKDGHTQIILPSSLNVNQFSPIKFEMIENELVVTNAQVPYIDLIGQVVQKIEGKPVQQFLAEIKPFIWHETDFFYVNLVARLPFFFPDGLNISVAGEHYLIKMVATPRLAKPLRQGVLRYQHEGLSLYQIEDSIMVKIQHFMSETMVKDFYRHVELLQQADKLIIDVRGNLGGNSGFADELAQAFYPGEFLVERYYYQLTNGETYANGSQIATWPAKMLDEAAQTRFHKELASWRHQAFEEQSETAFYPEFAGKLAEKPVVLLQDAATYSSAENFLMNFIQRSKTVTIGTSTAGSTGQSAWIPLETGGYFQVTAKAVELPAGTIHHNQGLKPEIEISLTIQDVQNGADPILARALKNDTES
ncbi:hypothetical protein RU97_GL000822 [Enterococcus canis]|uniref:Tail specific protease domain-containing protein n=1 Tax=Enterococcus canis TaxID=214095 RepID=A0A1L8RHJ2_9ENTE|nr:S41 family peptidase [Enterococcus canis]OJG19251.1 hypothetical protein RU97_GL000822 [Enterococcus canis]